MRTPITSSIDIAALEGAGFAAHPQPTWIDAVSPPRRHSPEADPMPAGERYLDALRALARRTDEGLALSLRVPFCAVHCLCCERPVQAGQPGQVIDEYVDDLCSEIEIVATHAGPGRDVLQLVLGGGSATELDESQLARLVTALQRHWRLPADAVYMAECDPRRADGTRLTLLRGLGFRAVTFGVLDLDPEVQCAIGRCQSGALVDDVCELARASGIEIVNLDLMAGLPRQTEHGWRRTVERVIAMAPDRITMSRYRHRPWLAPVQRLIDADDLPDAAGSNALVERGGAMLRAAGYRWIGADHFVLEGDELSQALDAGRLRRNLVGYTGQPAGQVLGLGVGAVSDIDGGLFWNEPLLPAWREGVRSGELPVVHAQPATASERKRRRAIEQLLCSLELPAEHARGGLEDAYAQLARRAADGTVRALEDRIVVTDKGRSVLHRLCAEFGAPSRS
jgi:oxygen-independent coproporphyrinogen III oxidase